MANKIDVVNLRPFLTELRRAGAEFPKEMRAASLEGAKLVADGTRTSLAGRSNPGTAREVVASVKALASQRDARVRMAGPSALGTEFGAISLKQFAPWRGNGENAGYSLFPTLRSRQDEIVESYGDAMDRVAKRAFPD